MGRCRFVQPGIVRLLLSDGEWLDVKAELTAGEQRHVMANYVKDSPLGARATVDFEQVGKTRILEYVVDWSLVGFGGQREPFSESALDCLDMDTYREIDDAIDRHEAAISAARDARKKNPVGVTTSPVTSASPFAADGVSSGSAT
jgi:hypothetical protein